MSTTITTRLERRIEANPRGLTIIETIRGNMIQAALTPDEARQIAAALTADQGGQWTAADFPDEGEFADLVRKALSGAIRESGKDLLPGTRLRAIRDLLAQWMNAHHPKPDPGAMSENYTPEGVDIVMRNLADARRERDAAVERADQAEARIEGWREAHDALMENPCPVALDEVEKAIDTGVRGTTDGDLIDPDADLPAGECARLAINAVWALVSGSDRAVYVVRESDLPEVERDEDGNWIRGDVLVYGRSAELEMVRQHVASALETVADCEAVARAIEAEQAVDPIMGAIRDGLNVWGTTDEGVRQIAESVRRAISNDGGENAL